MIPFFQMQSVPSVMRAVRLKELINPEGLFPRQANELNKSIEIADVPVPEPGPGEVLIKLKASPIQPADLWFMQGKYGKFDYPPVTPGIEGAGKVVKAGKGVLPKLLLGQTVACGSMQGADGTWAEYVVTRADMCIPLVFGLNAYNGSMLMANPLSALKMVLMAREKGAKAIANNAAASALGRYLEYFALKKGLKVVNIVDSQEKKDELKKENIESIVAKNEDDISMLKQEFSRVGVSVAFDTLGGVATKMLVNALPKNGEVVIYGGLSEDEPILDIKSVIFEGKKISGFWVTEWAVSESKLKMAKYSYEVQRAMKVLEPKVRKEVALDSATEAIEDYLTKMSAGKFLFY